MPKPPATPEPSFELELDVPGAAPPPKLGAKPAAKPPAARAPETGMEDVPSLGDIELDMGAPAPAAGVKPAAKVAEQPPDDGLGDGEVGALEVGLAIEDEAKPTAAAAAPKPRGAAPAIASLMVTDLEVEQLAAYGTAPGGWLAAIGYTVRVIKRKRELAALSARVGADCETRRRQAQAELGVLLEAVRARNPEHGGAAAIALSIENARRAVAERAGQLESTRQDYAAKVSQLDVELAAKNQEAAVVQGERRKALILQEDATAKQTAAKAELARAERDLAAAPDNPALEAKKAAAAAALATTDAGVAHAKSGVAAVDRKLREAEKRIADVYARRRLLDAQAAQAHGAGVKNITAAEHDQLDASEAAARKLAQLHGELFQDGERARYADLDAEIGRLIRDKERHERAVTAYDKETYQRGLYAAVGLVIAVIVAIVVAIRML